MLPSLIALVYSVRPSTLVQLQTLTAETLSVTTRTWKVELILLSLPLWLIGLWDLQDVPMPLQLSLQPRNWGTRWRLN